MGMPVLLLGESGTGKSYALRNFEPGEVGIFNVLGKPLPFRGNHKTVVTRDVHRVRSMLPKVKAKAVVIDDFGYLITDMYMRFSYGEERMRDQYDVYKLIGHEVYGLINDVYALPNDVIVYMTMHTDTTVGVVQPLTIGKMLNEKVKLVGMFSTILLSQVSGGKYELVTNGMPPAKSSPGMLPERMENDLKAVDDAIRDYYDLPRLGLDAPAGAE